MKRVPVLVSGPLLLASALLGGCGALATRAGENGSEVWVGRVLDAAEVARLPTGCPGGIDLSAYGNDRFVQAREPRGRRMISVIAHVPPGVQVRPGDAVEIVPPRCTKGVMPEVKQVFGQ